MLTHEPEQIVAIIGGRGRASRKITTLHRPHASQQLSDDVREGRSILFHARAACGVRGTALAIRDVQYGPARRCGRCWSDSLALGEH